LNRQKLAYWKGRRSNRLGKGRLKIAEKKMKKVDCEKLQGSGCSRQTNKKKKRGGVESWQHLPRPRK